MSKLKFTLTLLSISAFFLATALGDRPTCSQMGSGPDDMIMESPGGGGGGGGGMIMNPKYQWDKRGGVVRVPIVLDHAYSYRERGIIFGGLQEIASKTCVKFAVHKETHSVRGHDHVYVSKTKSKCCWSYVGRVGNGKQDLSLPIGCINYRTVVHEVMHALGFSHEHVRHDRDNYVEILWGNIQRGRERNFQKKHGRADPFEPYDYESIMHYERNAFGNGQDTIRPLRGNAPIGKGRHMSHWDVVKINRMYKCGGGGGGGRGYSSPFFGFGGSSGHPEGSSDTDEDISYDQGPPLPGGRPGESEDDEENDVFSGIDDDPSFAGLFSGGSSPQKPRGHRGHHPRSRGPPPPSFSGERPYGPPPPGASGPISGPSGPDYDDAPKNPGALGPLIAPGHSFPDNPFAKIPLNPFSPRSGLPVGAADEAPPEYYESPPQENKDYFTTY